MSSTTVPTAAWRKSKQPLLPLVKPPVDPGRYDLYPAFDLRDEAGEGIGVGFAALAQAIAARAPAFGGLVLLEGFGGVFWPQVREGLTRAFGDLGLSSAWRDAAGALRPPAELDAALAPFLGGDDPLFGVRHHGALAELFDDAALAALRPEPGADLSIVYGSGAALTGLPGLLVYLDLPKNEVQYRSRAGSAAPLGASREGPLGVAEPRALDPKQAYKRFFFVDWPLLAEHKRRLLPRIDLFVDSQRPEAPVFVSGQALRATLEVMSRSPLRARPWFEAGPWGGQWMKQHIPGLPDDEVNLAWSFELITPENGLLLSDGRSLLEASFDLLMFQAHEAVLGEAAARFGHHFPIRFNYLDTVGGGNLSVQVHPSDAYVRSRFGEGFTQDECYYVSDTVPAGAAPPVGSDGAVIYLGLRDGVDPTAFRAALEDCVASGVELDVQRFVHHVPARKHGLYLIPNGTVHSSGEGSLVLEISATPYLYTFKMYDWQRLDLDGRPRPMNLERAFDNIDFGRTPEVIEREHIAPELPLAEGADWRLVHLPTHPQHFYDVHRLAFSGEVEVDTDGVCHVLNLVEGSRVLVRSENGESLLLSYAETIVLPAATGRYTLRNLGGGQAMVVKAFVKPGRGGYQPGSGGGP